ncbi:TPR repeat-containing protein YrrB [Aquicella siphonis]|uniref:TPR repeat-containing protein YrrB n=1 Tax=Aquicella siphonis TaxID=254247 RepID=A0A5E4PJP0_9COXI|nr:tetratricopeptide repeat protein [Aquicella siphonis]VVC76785.1 TPR repeat-containing protein YrrB [Aquicella siphonis]
MKKAKLTLAEIQELHKAGRLDEAKAGYFSWLEDHPHDASVLHLYALVCAEQGEWDDAQRYLEKALAIDPADRALYLHLANICKAKGEYDHAIRVLHDLIRLYPRFAAGFNNLGTVYFALGKWNDAIDAFKTAIDLQTDFVDAYYNLGLALGKAGRYDEALSAYRALLEISPAHAGGRFQLACLLMKQNEYQAAADQFLLIEQEYPYHFETQSNLATCFLKLGWLQKAGTHYLKALEIIPDDIQILYNLGVISVQLGRMRDAVEYYSRCIQENPDFYEARNNLAVAFLALKKKDRALQQFREALRMHPENASIRHIISVLSQDRQISASPAEYIQSLFDSYADHYDAHITQTLHYQVPEFMRDRVGVYYDLSKVKWDVLDLGCGTGLCGALFRSAARSLKGVDLSDKMLAEAARKQCYDQLVHLDILSFLDECADTFDLVLAGDVLVYFGNLEELFSAVYPVLRNGGLFAFNAEVNLNESFSMTESGRFAHSKAYLDRLIGQHHLAILDYKVIPLRTQNQAAIQGHLYLLKKE